MSLGTYRIGADIVVALDVLSGSVSGTVTAKMVYVTREDPTAISGTGIDMVVTERPAYDATPGGYTFTLPGASTTGLAQGIYAVDAKVVSGDSSISITDTPAFITLIPSVM